MDFREQKWMNGFGYISKQSFPRLSNAPAKVLINPGLAQIAPLYHVFVPISSRPHGAHEIIKNVNISHQNNPEIIEMTGSGLVEPDIVPPKKELSPGVLYSFLHPKIETDKITFEISKKPERKRSADNVKLEEASESKKPKLSKVSHKFQFM